MEKALFGITCTTCRARLAVRSEAIVGKIVQCPRCQSMVYVEPPPEWLEAARAAKQQAAAAAATPPLHDGPPASANAESPGEAAASLPAPTGTAPPAHWLTAHKWLALSGVFLAGGIILTATVTAVIAERTTKSLSSSETVVSGPNETVVPAERPSPPAPAKAAPSPTAQASTAPATPAATKPLAPKVAASGGAAKGTKPLPKQETAKVKPASQPVVAARVTAAKQPSSSTKPNVSAPPKKEAAPPASDPFGPLPNEVVEASPRTPPPEVKKLAPAAVDVVARLADHIPEITIPGIPLYKACDLMASISTLPITLDVDAMSELGVSPRDLVSISLSDTTVGAVLQAIAGKRRLAPTVEAGQVLVTSPAEYRETLRRIHYTVSDLTGRGTTSTNELAGMVRRLVAPQSWQVNGGRGAVEPDGDALLVVQTGDVHQQVLDFCEKLRLARHQPLRSRGDRHRFSLTTRSQRAHRLLAQPVTINYRQPAPLARILADLAEATQADLLIDRIALAAAQTSDQVPGSVVAKNKPLGTALDELLGPLGLAYRIVDAHTLQITTPEALDDRMELEFYGLDHWLKQGVAGPILMERLKARVGNNSWSDAGGPGEMYFDAPSGYILVLQSQPVQFALGRLLARP